jgi:rod shape-determining protein MreD
MRLRIELLVLALALLALQQLAAVTLPSWMRPDLILAFAMAMGLRTHGTAALVVAFAIGFAVDALSSAPPGLHALACGTACAATRLSDRALYLRAPGPWGLYAAGYTLAHVALLAVLLRAVGTGSMAPLDLLARAPGAAIATGLVSALLLPLFQRLDGGPGREEPFAPLVRPGGRA